MIQDWFTVQLEIETIQEPSDIQLELSILEAVQVDVCQLFEVVQESELSWDSGVFHRLLSPIPLPVFTISSVLHTQVYFTLILFCFSATHEFEYVLLSSQQTGLYSSVHTVSFF